MMRTRVATLIGFVLAGCCLLPAASYASCTLTTNLGLCLVGRGDADWDLNWNANFEALDGLFSASGKIPASKGGTGLDTSASTGTARVDAGTWSIGHVQLGSAATASLPAAGTAGRLLRLSDGTRQALIDTGTVWAQLARADFKAFGGSCANSAAANKAALDAAHSALASAGGGTVVFTPCAPGTGTKYEIGGSKIVLPNKGDGGTYHTQAPIRWTSDNATGHGTYAGAAPTGGVVLDLTWDNAGSSAKIVTLGTGVFEVDHLSLRDSSSPTTSTPFILTTGTTVYAHDLFVHGTKSGASADQDFLILGGTKTDAGGPDPCSGPDDEHCAFQGYISRVIGVDANRIRRLVYCRTYCNGNVFAYNMLWQSCGGAAPFEIVGHATNSSTGNIFVGNMIEAPYYTFAFTLTRAVGNQFLSNSVYDAGTGMTYVFNMGTGAQRNFIIDGQPHAKSPLSAETDTNTYMTSEQGQVWRLANPISVNNLFAVSGGNPIDLWSGNYTGDKWTVYPAFSDSATLQVRYDRAGGGNEYVASFARLGGSGYYGIKLHGATANRIYSEDGPLTLRSATSKELVFGDGTTDRWYFWAGQLIPNADNAYDIGNDSTRQVRSIYVESGFRHAAADPGGVASFVTYTGSDNTGTSRSTGVGTIKFADATARDNLGFLKIYLGTTAYYIPLFDAN